jgi:ketosteroid isomerase-like protein
MNERDNIELIRKVYAAFAAGDAATILANVADHAPWINYGPATVPYAGSRAGKAQILEFFQAIGDSTTGGVVIPEQFVAQGDMVVVTGRYKATVRTTGAEIDSPIAHFYRTKRQDREVGRLLRFRPGGGCAHRQGRSCPLNNVLEQRTSYGCGAAFCCRAKKSSIAAKAGAATLVWLPPGTST